MRAALSSTVGEEVDIVDDMSTVDPGPGQVAVRIGAAGICHSDLSGMNGTLRQPLPFVPGHEGAGEVVAVGDEVRTVAVGDHVIVAWNPPCGRCKACLRGEPNLCLDILITSALTPNFVRDGQPVYGFVGTGTWAETVVLPEQAAIVIPSDVPFDVAALIGCGVTTGVGAAVNTAKVAVGSSVIVFGCGGVGISAIQGARLCGAAEIVAVDTVPAKLDVARHFGATHGVHPDGVKALRAELTGNGFDYAFECIGTGPTFRAVWDAARRGGTAVIVGAGGTDATLTLNGFELFNSEKKLLGSYYGSADVRTEFGRLIRLWRAGRLDLEGMVSARIGLDGINDAIQAMKRGDVVRQVVTF